MQYTTTYQSPLGGILLAADEIGLTGLWFEGAKFYAQGLAVEHAEKKTPVLSAVECWLHQYFSGEKPASMPPVHMLGTPFQKEVWNFLLKIPYGDTTTYGAIAEKIAIQQKLPHMSAQAVGGAVGHNRISIIIPCHRVVGSNGSLTGYAGGLEKKSWLLTHEGVDISSLFISSKSPAL